MFNSFQKSNQIDFFLTNLSRKQMYLSLLMLALNFIGCVGNLTCSISTNDPISGAQLWQRNLVLDCYDNSQRFNYLKTLCRVGTEIITENPYVITFEALKFNNSISCTFESNDPSDFWEMNDIDTNPMNEKTFTVGDVNASIDVYFGQGKNFTIYVSQKEILKLSHSSDYYSGFSSFAIERDDSIVEKIQELNSSWIRIHFTPITLNHAGQLTTLIEFFQHQHRLKHVVTIDLNIVSNFTCSENSSLPCQTEKFSPTTELTCGVSRISFFQWRENIVCRIDNEILNSTTESKFLIDSFQRKGKRVVCFSENTNQTWTSNPIQYLHREIVNTTRAISVSNTNEENCTYSWVARNLDFHREIFEELKWWHMQVFGYGTYYRTIWCLNSCSYNDYIINYINPTPSTTPQNIPMTMTTNRLNFSGYIWFFNTIVSIVLILMACGMFWQMRKYRYDRVQQSIV